MIADSDTAIPLLTPDQLSVARDAHTVDGRFDEVVQQLGCESETQVLAAVARTLGLETVDLTEAKADLKLLESFPIRLIHRFQIFPLWMQRGSLVLAVSDPFNLHAVDAVSSAMGLSVTPAVVPSEDLAKFIRRHLGVGAETIDDLVAQQRLLMGDVEMLDDVQFDGSEDAEAAQQASVVRLVNEILTEAIEARASDIHVEAQESGLKLRYRVDGVLQRQPTPPEMNRFQAAIVSRLKIMARLNIAEKRVPQDGRIKLRVKGREIDVRVSIIPMLHGEGVVMRVLDKESLQFSLRGIGMSETIYEQFQRLIRLPHGIILVTGPTGSGKTTTLYSALNEIKNEETKIITTEDPIEYQLEGINQIQVHTKVGLTFAASLRSILRHDPDVVLVGEIRDLETAENAIQASLTGHLVFSTLHTNDSAGAFMRLCDMGVEPFLVTSTVEGVMAQRLVRRLCPDCRRPLRLKQDEVPHDFPWEEVQDKQLKVYGPQGCPACRQTGYRGRIGIYELLLGNDRIRALANERQPTHLVEQAAVEAGMRTLRMDGWDKVLQGVTSVDEVLRVTKED
ncbi:MAG: Flp pilus assembly complex ATPase component TadA [Planctomycetaceae bacterium]|nr:Flp pilus assembly complex ATPase component TadA [Planctomycetaceae bacterium]